MAVGFQSLFPLLFFLFRRRSQLLLKVLGGQSMTLGVAMGKCWNHRAQGVFALRRVQTWTQPLLRPATSPDSAERAELGGAELGGAQPCVGFRTRACACARHGKHCPQPTGQQLAVPSVTSLARAAPSEWLSLRPTRSPCRTQSGHPLQDAAGSALYSQTAPVPSCKLSWVPPDGVRAPPGPGTQDPGPASF
ncbi:hypothetical protein H1C71_035953 [Ictidomys tridecemlineatus]|nr:hypothetical protein H1C71_035953 [Ictidomys tridecemlineatus]